MEQFVFDPKKVKYILLTGQDSSGKVVRLRFTANTVIMIDSYNLYSRSAMWAVDHNNKRKLIIKYK
jgi:hypothetical protein